MWNKKDKGIGIRDVEYQIAKKCHSYVVGRDKRNVCLSEKQAIMKDKDGRSLNKRTELLNKCRHKCRQKLANKKKL